MDVGRFYDGTRQTASVNARLGITDQFGVEPNISLNWLARLGTSATVRVAGARATYTMTPRMFVAALVQHSSMSRSIATNLRFRWEYQPGSELFACTLMPSACSSGFEDRRSLVEGCRRRSR